MACPPITVTIIALNEERNIARAIESARFADEVLVIDSGSIDRTTKIAESLGARVINNPWPGYGQQKNFAQDRAAHDWVLNIDADEEIPPELAAEIRRKLEEQAKGEGSARGFFFPRKTFYLGQWIRHGGWYPNHLVRLADRRFARWTEPNVHERLEVKGTVAALDQALLHHSFPTIKDQILTNVSFSHLGSQELLRAGHRPSRVRLLVKPVGKFMETYLIKRGFLDGWAGFIISVNAAYSMFMKYAYLLETDIRDEDPDHR